MKILYLNHPEADYSGYALYHGLCQVLGADNVVDFPSKRSYHGEIHHYPNQYPSGRVGGEMTTGTREGGVTGPFEWSTPRLTREHSEADVRGLLRAHQVDLVFCEAPRALTLHWLRQLRVDLPPRLILSDGEDYEDIRQDLIGEFRFGLYLKRDLVPRFAGQVFQGCAVKPFPFSTCLLERPPERERDIDVLCAMGDTHSIRKKILAAVERLGREGYRVDTARTSWHDYIDRLCRSKISVAPRGHGQDTLRRWDIPAAGALMLQERLTLIESNPLRDGEHMIAYAPDASDVEAKLRHWLSDDEGRRRIARTGQDHVWGLHTPAARAREALAWARERWPELR